MNTIETAIYQAPTWSSQPCWRAYAIINDRRTTITCGHSHKTQELAQACASAGFNETITGLVAAHLSELHDGIMEAHWTDHQRQKQVCRFRYLPTAY